jgi:4-amino-4-deoxy-L-arabinose transferase-like glycosyltransferase
VGGGSRWFEGSVSLAIRRPFNNTRVLLLGILLFSLAFRLLLFSYVVPHPERFYTPDSNEYVTLAKNLNAGYFHPDSPLFDMGLLRTPGYPAFLAAIFAIFGPRSAPVILVQIVISVATVAALFLVTEKVLSRKAALIASAALAVDPTSIIHTSYLQPEILFTAVFLAASFVWFSALQGHSLRKSLAKAGLSGLLFGLATLVRPIALYIPVLLVPLSWIFLKTAWRRRMLFAGIFLLAFLIPSGGWMAHNAAATGVPVLSTIEAAHLLYYRAAGAVIEEKGGSLDKTALELEAMAVKRTKPNMNAAQVAQVESSLAVEIIAAHPVGALKTVVKGSVRMLFGPGQKSLLWLLVGREGRLARVPALLLLVTQFLILGAVLLGAAGGTWSLLRERNYLLLAPTLGVIAYLFLSSASPGSYARFRVPVSPYLSLLAGIGYAAYGRLPAVGSRVGYARCRGLQDVSP